MVAKKQQHGQGGLDRLADQPPSVGPVSTDSEPSLIVPDEKPIDVESETNPEPVPVPVEEKSDSPAPANNSDASEENPTASEGEAPAEEALSPENKSSEQGTKKSP